MKYALLILMAVPLFAGEVAATDTRSQDDLAQGKMIPVVENGETKSWKMDPSTNELENKKITKVEEDTSDDE